MHVKGRRRRRYLVVSRLLSAKCFAGVDQIGKLPHCFEGESQASDDLLPDGPIENISLLGIKVGEMYSPLLKWAKKSRRVYKFTYDWRRSPLEGSWQLEAFVMKLLNQERAAGVWDGKAQIMVHSNGGLVSWPVVQRRPELFHSVLWAASGALGNVSFLPDLSIRGYPGNALSGNTTMMTPLHWLSWTSGYHFLPCREEEAQHVARFGAPTFCEADGTPIDADLHDIETYRRLQLGPYHPRSGIPLPLSASDEVCFSEVLTRARAFRLSLAFNPAICYPPQAVIARDATPTPTTWVRADPAAPFSFAPDGSDARCMVGDGRFDFEEAGPPNGVPVVVRLKSKGSHTGVAVDMPLVEEALSQLLRAF